LPLRGAVSKFAAVSAQSFRPGAAILHFSTLATIAESDAVWSSFPLEDLVSCCDFTMTVASAIAGPGDGITGDFSIPFCSLTGFGAADENGALEKGQRRVKTSIVDGFYSENSG
jgi:hypothetical protein